MAQESFLPWSFIFILGCRKRAIFSLFPLVHNLFLMSVKMAGAFPMDFGVLLRIFRWHAEAEREMKDVVSFQVLFRTRCGRWSRFERCLWSCSSGGCMVVSSGWLVDHLWGRGWLGLWLLVNKGFLM